MAPDGLSGVGWTNPPPLTPGARKWAYFWGVSIVLLGAVDLWRDRQHDGTTLSELTRYVFHTHTPEGRALFKGALAILSRHILH